MKRRVIKQGNNTLTITLPRKWTQKFGVEQGDELEVGEKGGYLEIWSKKGLSLKEFKTKIKKSTLSHLKSIISNAYKKGYDKIILEYEEETILKDIQKIIDSLLGIEIVSKSRYQCEIRNIAKELETEFESMLKNSFILSLEMGERVLSDIKNKTFDKREDIGYQKEMITRYTDFGKRILNKHRKNETEMVFMYLVVWSLEKIANEYKYIYDYGVKCSPKNFSKQMLNFFEKTKELLGLYYQAFYQRSDKKIKQVGEAKDKLLFKTYYELQPKLTKDDQPVMHHLASIARRVWDMCGPFYGITS